MSPTNPVSYSSNRKFEWFSSIAVLFLGIGVLLSLAADYKITGAFMMLTRHGFSMIEIGSLMTVIGGFGCVTLWANSRWKGPGCYARWACSICRLFIFTNMLGGAIIVLVEQKEFFPGLVLWTALFIFDGLAIIDAFRDRMFYFEQTAATEALTVSENATVPS